ncbi:MAG: HNH endonuclease [Alistipes sp.]|jgi:hypothetical protein|nr:HNH endonuclease [Alistipes sp.]
MAKRWDKDDIKILTARYANNSNVELAAILYRSPQSIAVKAHKMGLHKSDIFLAQQGFKKGYTPFNKGRKMGEWLSPEVHAKIKANQARTAERNRAATKPDGTISRRYNGDYLKVAGRWVKLSHHVWMTHNGPVPEGYAVFHRDGDHLNVEPENLYIDRKNDVSVHTARRSPEERSAIGQKIWVTRRRKQAEKHATLDAMLAEIRKSENNIYYTPKISQQ